MAHPREEHLIPLMVAVGAAEAEAGERVYHEDAFMGGLAVSSFRFGAAAGDAAWACAAQWRQGPRGIRGAIFDPQAEAMRALGLIARIDALLHPSTTRSMTACACAGAASATTATRAAAGAAARRPRQLDALAAQRRGAVGRRARCGCPTCRASTSPTRRRSRRPARRRRPAARCAVGTLDGLIGAGTPIDLGGFSFGGLVAARFAPAAGCACGGWHWWAAAATAPCAA